ncbi:MAG: aspartate kinase [Pseudomonadota bacterium]
MSILVLKFGGSSLATIEKIQAAARRVAALSQHHRCVVVVSAMGDDTDILLEQAVSLHPQKHLREYDMLLATGEQKSMALMAMALKEQQIQARSLTGWQAKIQTTPQYSHARIVHIDTRVIEQCWQNNEVPVIAGFQGVCDHEITTLGRGGSDLTAVALAAALNADECQIFTDVEGVYSADPRIVPNAAKWDEITYETMLELASVGAQVLHNRAVELACKMHVKLRVLSSFVEGAGTMVSHTIKKISTVSGVAVQANQAVISVTYAREDRYHHEILTLLQRHKVSMATVHISVYKMHHGVLSFSIAMPHAEKIAAALQSLLGDDLEHIETHTAQAQISIVGMGVQSSERVVAQVHQWLAENKFRSRLATSSESRFSFYIDENSKEKAVKDLHALFHLQAI